MLRDFASRYFPDGTGPTMTLAACMFTNTPDGHFIIDQHPQYPQISYASPCSGHGYKFASVIGEVMAEIADLGYSRWDISLFRADRFGVPTSNLFRDKGPAPRAQIVAHDPFGSWQGKPERFQKPVRFDSHSDTRDPRYWQRNAVTPFW
jgi:sarcosine oxidase